MEIGITVIPFTNEDVNNNLDEVIKVIKSHLFALK